MRKFKTESKRLLDLMVNSIYTNQEIFLRELISNASDAVDKLYFKSLTESDVKFGKDELRIDLSSDKDARTITVSDTGIGMDKEALEKNLGTIAHSGSLDFKTENADAQGDDVDIIGQFGVGFYSSFMVAQKVEVISRAYGSDQAYRWVSDGIEGYTITEAEKDTHGTDIILYLKDDSDDADYSRYLDSYTLQHLVKQYSNYVRYPIQMMVSKQRELPKPDDAADDYTPQFESYEEIETINSMIPIWKRRKSDVTQEEYDEFYKSDFHDFSDPVRTVSIHAEGALQYDALLFVPGRAPYDLYSKDYKKGLALYTSGVLIQEKCEELLPDCFNFVRGVVDSQDLSLNISRETLQHNSQLIAIERKIEKKIKSELTKMRDNDRETYLTFFENFGRGLKYGIYSSYGQQKELLADLLVFYSAKLNKMVTLDEYLEAATDDQQAIYYAIGESTARLEKMPIVSSVVAKGYDVLLCTQDVDEFCLQSMMDYREKPLKNVAGGNLDLETDDEKQAAEEVTKQNSDLFDRMKDILGDAVTKVVVSTRLADAPACITAEGPVSLEMEKMMAGMPDAQGMKAQRVLEINPQHQVFATMQQVADSGDTEKLKLYTDVLYNQALLVEGLPIDDPIAYSRDVCSLMN